MSLRDEEHALQGQDKRFVKGKVRKNGTIVQKLPWKSHRCVGRRAAGVGSLVTQWLPCESRDAKWQNNPRSRPDLEYEQGRWQRKRLQGYRLQGYSRSSEP